MKRLLLASALGVAGLAVASPASAQLGVRPDWNYGDEAPQSYNDSRRAAYDNGFREGLREGERDGRSRNSYDFRDERAWQRGDSGYHRSFGDRGRYQQSFRSGYEAGYADGYRRFGSGTGGYGNRGPGGVYPNTRGDYGYGYPNQGGFGYGSSPAYANGVRDGYEKGREDGRDRDPFDPQRHKWYRAGDHDYRSQYGPKRQYEDIYRRGFQEGYERGYREWGYRR
jgi:flagellar biosynthesis/type III secretory pathway protein FliH